MKNLLFPLAFLVLVACNKEEPDINEPTTTINTAGLDTFEVAAAQVQESFVGIISRTSCGACGEYGHPTFDQTLEGNDKLNGVAFHYNSNDVMYTDEAHSFAAFMTLGGTPTFTEGLANFANNSSDWKAAQNLTLGQSAQASIGISGTQNDRTFKLNLTIPFYASIGSEVNLAVYAIENNFVTSQRDYSANPVDVPDYIHNHILRESAAGLWGELLKSSPSNGDVLSYEWTYEAASNVDPEHVWFVAVLYEMDGNTPLRVINSQTVER